MQATTTDPQPNTQARHLLGVSLETIVGTLLGSFLTLTLSLIAYSLLDVSLGTVFAAVFLASLFAVGMAELVTNAGEWAVVSVVLAIASTVPILLGLFDHPELAAAGVQLVLMCLTLAATVVAMITALSRLIGFALAAVLTVLLLLAWLTWPVWMSPYFDSSLGAFFIDHLLAHQPLFAVGGAYQAMGDWTHSPLAYAHLTNLGQDVMFAPPNSAWRAIVSHAGVAGVLGVLAFVRRNAASLSSGNPDAPSHADA